MSSIKIETKLINNNTNDFTKSILYNSINETVKSFKTEFTKQFKKHTCENHKEQSRGKITISANKTKPYLRYTKTNFCCNEFSETINITS